MLELERRDDLARAVERDPSLGASALRDCERIVWGNLHAIEKAAGALVARSEASLTGDAGIYMKGGTRRV